ncbi:GNAT family N-acetyltransferase [Nocardia stercoris]|uniref:N-acetyltransferase n=1 Tax=Nocardia stercoris TaxID=2483361 RepID=A0A3M2L4J9_9NOCA|nr:GNAT family N-acetyltransferase [Nocardia stercoris]RMI29438.1 N-acetyltransferase [Nocardia stercoris]
MTSTGTELVVREAAAADDPILADLASVCPMDGDISLCVDRYPSFFALSRLEGDPWRVGVVDGPDGTPIACIGVARKHVYLEGEPTYAAYIGDMKVHPDFRRDGIGIGLMRWAHEVATEWVGADGVKILTVLDGNTPVERMFTTLTGSGTPMRRAGSLRSLSVPLLFPRRQRDQRVVVDRAVRADFREMAALWQQIAPRRNGTAVLDHDGFEQWLTVAPGLAPSDYLVARRRRDDAIVGFMGLWDQHTMKQMRVVKYSAAMRPLVPLFNLFAAVTGVAKLPAPGRELRYRNAVHLCVHPGDTATLRALLVAGSNWLRAEGYSIFTVGLDRNDPLLAAFSGLLAQPADVNVTIDRVGPGERVALSADRPLHFEISNV